MKIKNEILLIVDLFVIAIISIPAILMPDAINVSLIIVYLVAQVILKYGAMRGWSRSSKGWEKCIKLLTKVAEENYILEKKLKIRRRK